MIITGEYIILANEEIEIFLKETLNEQKLEYAEEVEFLKNARETNNEIVKANYEYVILQECAMSGYVKVLVGVKDKKSARAFAIELQDIIMYEKLYQGEISELQNMLEVIGAKYGLINEFREEGLI